MNILKIFNRRKPKVDEFKEASIDVLNISDFNAWFVSDKKDPNVYANAGIFLRVDKLSDSMFIDYFNSLDMNPSIFMDGGDLHNEFREFNDMVIKDWLTR